MATETTITNPPHVIPKGLPVTAIVGGVVMWRVAKGATVAKYDPLALVDDVEITAAYNGRVSALMVAEGGTVAKGATIAYIDDGKPVTPQKPLQAAAPTVGPNTRTTTETRNPPQQVQTAAPIAQPSQKPRVRRGSHIEAATLAAGVVELPSEKAPKSPKKPQKKTVNRTYSIGDHQEADIARLAKTLQLEALSDDSILPANESELVRAAVDLLLGLPRPALLEVLRANREREKVGKWGRGRPRPGK